MTDTARDTNPFPGFPGFPPAEMLDKMWDMMRLTPFGAAFPGMHPGTAQGMGSPFAAISDMVTPLMSVEEFDKRITDMRAVEQWLKLNLNMLQSAIQALEVQRATLATLRAFGASFAQASMTQPARGEADESSGSPSSSAWSARPAEHPAPEEAATEKAGEQEGTEFGAAAAPFDPSAWWNLLQSQFNQLANFAMSAPGASQSGTTKESDEPDDPPAGSGASRKAGATSGKRASSAKSAAKSTTKSTAKRPASRKTGSKTGSKTAGSSSAASGK